MHEQMNCPRDSPCTIQKRIQSIQTWRLEPWLERLKTIPIVLESLQIRWLRPKELYKARLLRFGSC
jgi:hypothetical protein